MILYKFPNRIIEQIKLSSNASFILRVRHIY